MIMKFTLTSTRHLRTKVMSSSPFYFPLMIILLLTTKFAQCQRLGFLFAPPPEGLALHHPLHPHHHHHPHHHPHHHHHHLLPSDSTHSKITLPFNDGFVILDLPKNALRLPKAVTRKQGRLNSGNFAKQQSRLQSSVISALTGPGIIPNGGQSHWEPVVSGNQQNKRKPSQRPWDAAVSQSLRSPSTASGGRETRTLFIPTVAQTSRVNSINEQLPSYQNRGPSQPSFPPRPGMRGGHQPTRQTPGGPPGQSIPNNLQELAPLFVPIDSPPNNKNHQGNDGDNLIPNELLEQILAEVIPKIEAEDRSKNHATRQQTPYVQMVAQVVPREKDEGFPYITGEGLQSQQSTNGASANLVQKPRPFPNFKTTISKFKMNNYPSPAPVVQQQQQPEVEQQQQSEVEQQQQPEVQQQQQPEVQQQQMEEPIVQQKEPMQYEEPEQEQQQDYEPPASSPPPAVKGYSPPPAVKGYSSPPAPKPQQPVKGYTPLTPAPAVKAPPPPPPAVKGRPQPTPAPVVQQQQQPEPYQPPAPVKGPPPPVKGRPAPVKGYQPPVPQAPLPQAPVKGYSPPPPAVKGYSPPPPPKPAPVKGYSPPPSPAPVKGYSPSPTPSPAPVKGYNSPSPKPAPIKGYNPPPPKPAPVKGYSPPPPSPQPQAKGYSPSPSPAPVKAPPRIPAPSYPSKTAPSPKPATKGYQTPLRKPSPVPAPVKGRPAVTQAPYQEEEPQYEVKGQRQTPAAGVKNPQRNEYTGAAIQATPSISTTTILYDERATYTSPASSTPASREFDDEPNADIGFDDEGTAFSEEDMPSKMPLDDDSDYNSSANLNSNSSNSDEDDEYSKPRTVPPVRSLPLSPANKARRAQGDRENNLEDETAGNIEIEHEIQNSPFETTLAPVRSRDTSHRTSSIPVFGERIRELPRTLPNNYASAFTSDADDLKEHASNLSKETVSNDKTTGEFDFEDPVPADPALEDFEEYVDSLDSPKATSTVAVIDKRYKSSESSTEASNITESLETSKKASR